MPSVYLQPVEMGTPGVVLPLIPLVAMATSSLGLASLEQVQLLLDQRLL